MIAYKTIHQTDKTLKTMKDQTQTWIELNKADGWSLHRSDDAMAWEWVGNTFAGSDVEWAWNYMHRGVLRADLLRYLRLLVDGGVYSDVDVSIGLDILLSGY